MSEIATNGPYTFEVANGTALLKYQLVKMNVGGDVEESGATDQVIGVCCNNVPEFSVDRTRGDTATVLPLNHNGVIRLIAKSAVALGADLFKAVEGKVDDTGSEGIGYINITPGIAEDGDILEAIPYV